jgi:hypothetical protein
MRQVCLLILTVTLFVGGGTAVSAATVAECQPPALSKAIGDSAPASSLFLSSSFQECTINNFTYCPIGTPEDPEYCPCSWVWCDDDLACGYFH